MVKLRHALSIVAIFVGALSMTMAAPAVSEASELSQAFTAAEVTHDPEETTLAPETRSWYGTSFTFSSNLRLGAHYYDGSNVGIEMTCSSSQPSGTFSVRLYRLSGATPTFIGNASFKQNGFNKATWSNVGAGTYYFVLSKAGDGISVTCSEVAMYSW